MDFRILGPLEIHDGDASLPLGGVRQRAVLAFLLLHPKETVSASRLIDGLWGERPPPTAGKILQNYVSQLRRVLRDGLLVTEGRGYALRVAPGELDLDRFTQELEEGRRAQAAGNPERASVVLREALGLWRGPPLAEFADEPFAQVEIGRLDELRLTALIERIDADLALGHHQDLVGELESLVAEHPFQERLLGQLMLALYRSGRQAEALQAYQRARRMLVEELGIEPGQALRQLEQAILVHDPSLEPPALPRSGLVPAEARRSRALLVVVAVLAASAVAVAGVLLSRGDKPITAVSANAVGAIDPKTNKLVGAVPISNLPSRVAAGGGEVWAMSSYGGTVSRIDPSRMRVDNTFAVKAFGGTLSSIAFGADAGWVAFNGTLRSFGSITFPSQQIAFERNGYGDLPEVAAGRDSVWVTSQLQRAVIGVDRAAFHVIAKVRTPAVPLAIAVAGETVWVAGYDWSSKAGALLRIDPGRNTIAATIPLPGIPGDLAAGSGDLWVTVNSENAVWRIDPATGSVVRTIQVGSGPVAVAVGEGSVWVANAKDGTVSRIDPATNRVTATIRVGGSPRDVAVGSGHVWVAVL